MAGNTAAVCKRGHIVSIDIVDPLQRLEEGPPQLNPGFEQFELALMRRSGTVTVRGLAPFCDECGAPVMTACEQCGNAIRQPDNFDGVFGPPPFCKWCGLPYPWTNRGQRIGRLLNFLEFEEGLSEAQRLEVREAIDVLSLPEDDSRAKSQVRAGNAIRRLAPRAWDTAQPVLVNTLSAVLQKKLGLPG